MFKAGDRIVALANLINLKVLADKREEKAKLLRLAIWKEQQKGGKQCLDS